MSWDMDNHKDWLWYLFCFVGWVTEKHRTHFANVTDA